MSQLATPEPLPCNIWLPEGREGLGARMKYLATIEQRGDVLHVEVFERGSGRDQPVVLFACLSLPAAVGPLLHLLSLALGKRGPRSVERVRG